MNNIKHTDANNNQINLIKDYCSSAAITPPLTDSSSTSLMMNAISNKMMTSLLSNHHHNHHIHHPHDTLHSANSVIQQSKNAKTLALQNIYNNVPNSNDFIEQVKSGENLSHSNNATPQQQLVQMLKPFYNSMQMQLEKQQQHQHSAPSALISNENLYVIDSDRKLNLVDHQNQLSLLSQSNDYVHSLAVLNSEFLKQKKSTTDFMYQNLNYHQPSQHHHHIDISSHSHQHPHHLPHNSSTAPILQSTIPASVQQQQNYFNGYSPVSNHCNDNNDPSPPIITSNNCTNNSSANVEFLSKLNSTNKSNLEHMAPVAQKINNNSSTNSTTNNNTNSTTTTTPTTTTHTRGRKKSKRGPFICVECHKEFCNQSTLTKHMITHSDERKFVCAQCSKAFKRHDHLNGHLLTHREHKPYACDIEGCDKSYCDARSLRRHKEKHKENALQNNDASLLSNANISALTTEKAENTIYHTTDASAQLQFLALQQKKIPTPINQEDQIGGGHEIVPSKIQRGLDGNQSANKVPSLLVNNHHHSNSIHNENALLHQLLTSQEKSLFNNNNNTSTNTRQSIIQNNSTVIKSNLGIENEKSLEHSPSSSSSPIASYECSICLKKFSSSLTLNAHLRIHNNNDLKSNSFLIQKSTQIINNETINKTDLISNDSNLNTSSYESNGFNAIKNFELENLNKNFGYIEQPKQPNPTTTADTFNEINIFDKSDRNDIGFRNVFNTSQHHHQHHSHPHHQQQQQFTSSMAMMSHQDNDLTKHSVINSDHHLYEEQIYNNSKDNNQNTHGSNYEVSNNLTQTKGLNEVMFSPITPVTPMKNNSQFTFDFAADPNNERNVNVTDDKINCNDQINNYVTTLDNSIQENFCFEPEPEKNNNGNDNLLQKDDIEMQQSQQTNFDQSLNQAQINDHFVDHNSLNKNFDPDLSSSSNQFFDVNKQQQQQQQQQNQSIDFNSFGFPSNKFTSDLFNRRARKNIDINKTKELLSIKQIAASLQSFSQNYERNQQNQNQNNLNHSYSVPTTPACVSAPVSANPDSQQYQIPSISHHSLPSTPLDNGNSTHFNFNSVYGHEVASLPNHQQQQHQQQQQDQEQQFNFIFPTENSQQQPTNDNDLINCLNNSNLTEFIFDPKEIPNEFMDNYNKQTDNHSNNDNYQTIIPQENNNIIVNNNNNNQNEHQLTPPAPVDDLNNNVNFFESSTTSTIEYVPNNDNSNNDINNNDCKSLNSMMNTYIGTNIKDFIDLNNNEPIHQSNNVIKSNINSQNNDRSEESTCSIIKSNSQDNELLNNKKKESESIKDQNENYVNILNNNNNNDNADHGIQTNKNLHSMDVFYPKIKCLNKKISPFNNCNSVISTQIKKKKPRPSPLYIPPHVSTFVYHSRLRSPRLWNGGVCSSNKLEIKSISPPPYTPPPMLSPVRSGPGLFWKITNKSHVAHHVPVSCINNNQFFNNKNKKIDIKEMKNDLIDLKTPTTAYEPYEPCVYDIPQTDIQPHVNVGQNYQARIPEFNPNRSKIKSQPDKAVLFWSPKILEKIDDEKLDLFFKISCSMCIPGHGNNKEYALHLLHFCNGDILEALEKLVDSNTYLNIDHPSSGYYYADHDVWTENEIDLFNKSILKYDKDFSLISKEVKTKSVQECVQFYYLWKKNAKDLLKRLRTLRRKRDCSMYCDYNNDNENTNNKKTMNELQQNNCDENLAHNNNNNNDTKTNNKSTNKKTFYPCKKCNKTFKNLKSKNAHMKLHLD